jgi:hypothetical protein
MTTSYWKTQTQLELNLAESARAKGNEGKARVCARRAAGHIAGEYLLRQGFAVPSTSAYVLLQQLESIPHLGPQAREIVHYFLIHVNQDHKLPDDIDLIAEVRWLAQALLQVVLVEGDTSEV